MVCILCSHSFTSLLRISVVRNGCTAQSSSEADGTAQRYRHLLPIEGDTSAHGFKQ